MTGEGLNVWIIVIIAIFILGNMLPAILFFGLFMWDWWKGELPDDDDNEW